MCAAAFIAAALCCRICSPETGHSASQHKQKGEVGKDQVEIGGNMVLTHCVDRAQDWTNCQSCCKFTLQNALDHML